MPSQSPLAACGILSIRREVPISGFRRVLEALREQVLPLKGLTWAGPALPAPPLLDTATFSCLCAFA